MRIVVSGTHASGKSTLISDFHAARPSYRVLGDPFDDLDLDDPAGERSFAAQLRITATRLRDTSAEADVISERGPLDFAAYLMALEALDRSDGALVPRAVEIAERALQDLDLLVALPLSTRHPISVSADEDPALREAMDDALADLLADIDDDPDAPRVLVLTGDPETRLARLLQET